MPPRKPRFTNAQLSAALVEAKGMVTHAARILQCSPQTIHSALQRSPALRETLKWEREKTADMMESGLFKAGEKGEPWAITFYLRTQAKSRGYVETPELKLSSGEGFPVILQGVPSASRGD